VNLSHRTTLLTLFGCTLLLLSSLATIARLLLLLALSRKSLASALHSSGIISGGTLQLCNVAHVCLPLQSDELERQRKLPCPVSFPRSSTAVIVMSLELAPPAISPAPALTVALEDVGTCRISLIATAATSAAIHWWAWSRLPSRSGLHALPGGESVRVRVKSRYLAQNNYVSLVKLTVLLKSERRIYNTISEEQLKDRSCKWIYFWEQFVIGLKLAFGAYCGKAMSGSVRYWTTSPPSQPNRTFTPPLAPCITVCAVFLSPKPCYSRIRLLSPYILPTTVYHLRARASLSVAPPDRDRAWPSYLGRFFAPLQWCPSAMVSSCRV